MTERTGHSWVKPEWQSIGVPGGPLDKETHTFFFLILISIIIENIWSQNILHPVIAYMSFSPYRSRARPKRSTRRWHTGLVDAQAHVCVRVFV